MLFMDEKVSPASSVFVFIDSYIDYESSLGIQLRFLPTKTMSLVLSSI